MSETAPIDSAAFVEDFSTMMAVATADDNAAWYGNRPWKGGRAPYIIFEELLPLPDDPQLLSTTVADYKVWPLANPADHHTEQRRINRHGGPLLRKDEGVAFSVAPFQTMGLFARHAPDGPALITVSDRFVDHLDTTAYVPGLPAQIRSCLGSLISRSLLLGPEAEGVYAAPDEGQPGAFPRSLGALQSESYRELVTGQISRYMHAALHRRVGAGVDSSGYIGGHVVDKVDRDFIGQAIEEIDAVGLVSPGFWWESGVASGLVFDREFGASALRHLVARLEKLQEPEGGNKELADVGTEQLQRVMRGYVGRLLASYSQDPNRDGPLLQEIITAVGTERSVKLGGGPGDTIVELGKLIALSNGLVRGSLLKGRLQLLGIEASADTLRLDPTKLWNVPVALLRILYATAKPADQAAATEMFERDSLHVSVLEALRLQLRYASVDTELADARLRYPNAPESALPALAQAARNAKGPAQEQPRLWLRARQNPDHPISGYGLFVPGHGLIS